MGEGRSALGGRRDVQCSKEWGRGMCKCSIGVGRGGCAVL